LIALSGPLHHFLIGMSVARLRVRGRAANA
jgi:hypothetical protein